MKHERHKKCRAMASLGRLLLACLILNGIVSCSPDTGDKDSAGGAAGPAPAHIPSPGATATADSGPGADEDLAVLFRQAADFAGSGLYDRALEIYEKILEERPDHPPTLVNAARVHFIRGRTEEAIRLLERADQLVPGHPRTLGYLGMAEVKAGRMEDALIHLERSQLLDPTRIDVGIELAAAYFQLERYEDAGAAWNRVLGQDPNNLPARAGLERIRQLSQPAETGRPQP
jgi:tetratricopeptide (TPR) repeat protein